MIETRRKGASLATALQPPATPRRPQRPGQGRAASHASRGTTPAAPESPARPQPATAAQSGTADREIDLFELIWGICVSTRVALLLILTIALACLAGALIAQAPSEMLRSPDAMRTWVERVRPRYGVLTDLFQLVGLFGVFQTAWFRALLGLLTVNIVLCSVNRLPAIWHQVFGRPVWPRDGLFERGEPRQVVTLVGQTTEAATLLARRALRRGGYRLVERPADDPAQRHLYADRFRLMRFGTLLTHSALVLVLAAAVAGGPLGFFEESGFAVPVGSTREVGHNTGLAVSVEDYADEYYPDGRPRDYRSELVLYDQGREVAHQTVRVNEPLVYQGVRFHQSYYGQAAVVAVKDQNGTALYHDAVALTWKANDGVRSVGYFDLPGTDLHIYLIGTAGQEDTAIRSGELMVEAYRGRASVPTYRSTLTQRQPATVGDLEFTFEREAPFTGLRVVRDPSATLIWLAGTLLVLGLAMTFYFPHRKLWLRSRVVPGGAEVTLVGAGKAMAGEIARLGRQIGGADARPVAGKAAGDTAGEPDSEAHRAAAATRLATVESKPVRRPNRPAAEKARAS